MTLVGCSEVIVYSSNNYQDHCVLLVTMGNNPGIGASGVPEGGAVVIELGDSAAVAEGWAPLTKSQKLSHFLHQMTAVISRER